jgi:hypothetical protein
MGDNSMMSCTRTCNEGASAGACMTGRKGSPRPWLPSGAVSLTFQIIVHNSPQEGESIFEPAVNHVPGEAQNCGNFHDRERLRHVNAEAQ